jgi:KDO2-lipid IV(A) lauroyltransferase
VKTTILKLLIFSLSRLPLDVLRKLGTFIGLIMWILPTRMSSITNENIKRCYPELSAREQEELTKNSLCENCRTFLESCRVWAGSPAQAKLDVIHVTGTNSLTQAQIENKGILFIIPHLGNWEYLNFFLGSSLALTHMYQENKNKAMNRFIQEARSKSGTKFVKADNQGVKQLLHLLREKKAIGLMPDQEPANNTGSFSPFFGQAALSGNLATRLLDKTGAKPVLAYCIRRSNPAGFEINLEAINSEGTLSTADINQAIEKAVAKHPEQYLWSYKRFRTRPNGEPDFYQEKRQNLLNSIFSNLEYALINAALRITSLFSLKFLAKIAPPISIIAFRRKKKVARTNLLLCGQDQSIALPAITELAKSALETGRIWFCSKDQFDRSYQCLSSLPKNEGAIILTPPIGNREVLMRYLGSNFITSEYYHPSTRSSINQLIIKARSDFGISLTEHTAQGRQELLDRIDQDQLICLCPDQQPRLRGGYFIPFFTCPALTTMALPELLKMSKAKLYIGTAIRSDSVSESNNFELDFLPIDYDSELSAQHLLLLVNQTLEKVILKKISQYRWSDKRFNIRPPGHPKPY